MRRVVRFFVYCRAADAALLLSGWLLRASSGLQSVAGWLTDRASEITHFAARDIDLAQEEQS